jgi:hypothetical protein
MHWNRVAVAGTSLWVTTHEKPRRGGGNLAVGGAGAVGAAQPTDVCATHGCMRNPRNGWSIHK